MRMCSSNNNNSNANSYDNHKISLLTDNGSEFALHFKDVVKEHNLTHYFTYPRSPKMNAYNERFNRTIKDMFISYNEDLLFTDINEFNRQMAKWLIDYNTVLPHTSLGYKTPIEYAIMRDKKCNMYWTCALAVLYKRYAKITLSIILQQIDLYNKTPNKEPHLSIYLQKP